MFEPTNGGVRPSVPSKMFPDGERETLTRASWSNLVDTRDGVPAQQADPRVPNCTLRVRDMLFAAQDVEFADLDDVVLTWVAAVTGGTRQIFEEATPSPACSLSNSTAQDVAGVPGSVRGPGGSLACHTSDAQMRPLAAHRIVPCYPSEAAAVEGQQGGMQGTAGQEVSNVLPIAHRAGSRTRHTRAAGWKGSQCGCGGPNHQNVDLCEPQLCLKIPTQEAWCGRSDSNRHVLLRRILK